MNKKREEFIKNLLKNLNQKKSGLEEKINQAKKRMGKAESARTSWSDHTLTDIEEEIAIFNQQLKAVTSQIKEIESLSKQKIPSDKVAVGSLVTVEVGGEKQTFFLISSPVASLEQNLLSTHSPIGKALIGKKEGQAFTLPTPAGSLKVKILNVS